MSCYMVSGKHGVSTLGESLGKEVGMEIGSYEGFSGGICDEKIEGAAPREILVQNMELR